MNEYAQLEDFFSMSEIVGEDFISKKNPEVPENCRKIKFLELQKKKSFISKNDWKNPTYLQLEKMAGIFVLLIAGKIQIKKTL